MKISHTKSITDGSEIIMAQFETPFLCEFPEAIFREVVNQIATRYVEEHYGEIAAKLDQNAIASLAIADAGKKIAEEIERKPTVLREEHTQIFQRGIFGAMRRIR